MKDILYLEKMLTPSIITFAYWLLLLFALVSGLGTMFSEGVSFSRFLMGLGIIVGGAVAARIWCELLIVLFKINANIKVIAEQ